MLDFQQQQKERRKSNVRTNALKCERDERAIPLFYLPNEDQSRKNIMMNISSNFKWHQRHICVLGALFSYCLRCWCMCKSEKFGGFFASVLNQVSRVSTFWWANTRLLEGAKAVEVYDRRRWKCFFAQNQDLIHFGRSCPSSRFRKCLIKAFEHFLSF